MFENMFQFLIGTLKTKLPATTAAEPMGVSIPDRYAKNLYWLSG